MNTKQITVLTGNSAQHLSSVISLLSQEHINLRAHCMIDNGDGNCKLRMIVSDPQKAVRILNDNEFVAVVNDVVIIEADDKPGGLSRLLNVFHEDDVQVEYSYTAASESPGVAVMVFRFSDNSKAVNILENNKIILSERRG
jgi:hypothetical protein